MRRIHDITLRTRAAIERPRLVLALALAFLAPALIVTFWMVPGGPQPELHRVADPVRLLPIEIPKASSPNPTTRSQTTVAAQQATHVATESPPLELGLASGPLAGRRLATRSRDRSASERRIAGQPAEFQELSVSELPELEETLPAPEPLPAPVEERPLPAAPSDTPSETARPILDRPRLDEVRPPAAAGEILGRESLLRTYRDPPLGFTGPSSVVPKSTQEDSHFVPMEDRWRVGLAPWDRYGRGHPPVDDYPYVEGRWIDPFNQNALKGDYSVVGQNTFLNVSLISASDFVLRQVPTATTPFESTRRPDQREFFGNPDQFFYTHFFRLGFDLFHGDAGFKQPDWRARILGVYNVNYLDVQELAVVNPDVRRGTRRGRNEWTPEEWFLEKKLADLGPDFDTLSVRAGSQPFVSDFRGFIFADVNRGIRVFGSRFANRDQFNLIVFDQTEKDTNSQLNTLDDRHQNTVIANYFRQDFIWPGYTTQLSFHSNDDDPSTLFDRNDFLVRPDPVGVFAPHRVNAYYFGWAGDGHINRINVTHAFYWAVGRDSLNPIAGKKQKIDAEMLAVELSYDRDWMRFRTSFFWSSGDDDPKDSNARGFDSIFDNPNFAGGQFSYWNRQAIQLFGVNLVQANSIVPDLRSSKFQGQSNFVNPGLYLANFGVDFDITPKLKLITNANWLRFDSTTVLEQFVFQADIDDEIGTDLSLGVEYRPFLNNNAIVLLGISALIPGNGFQDLFRPIRGEVDTLVAGFTSIVLEY